MKPHSVSSRCIALAVSVHVFFGPVRAYSGPAPGPEQDPVFSLRVHPGTPISINLKDREVDASAGLNTWAFPIIGRYQTIERRHLSSIVALQSYSRSYAFHVGSGTPWQPTRLDLEVTRAFDKLFRNDLRPRPDFGARPPTALEIDEQARQSFSRAMEYRKQADAELAEMEGDPQAPASVVDWVMLFKGSVDKGLTVGELAILAGFSPTASVVASAGTGSLDLMSSLAPFFADRANAEKRAVQDQALATSRVNLATTLAEVQVTYGQLKALDPTGTLADQYLKDANTIFEQGFGYRLNSTPSEFEANQPQLFHAARQEQVLGELLDRMKPLEAHMQVARDPRASAAARTKARDAIRKEVDRAGGAAEATALGGLLDALEKKKAEFQRAAASKALEERRQALLRYDEFSKWSASAESTLLVVGFLGGLSSNADFRRNIQTAVQVAGAAIKALGVAVALKAGLITAAAASASLVTAGVAAAAALATLFMAGGQSNDHHLEWLRFIAQEIGSLKEEMRFGFQALQRQLTQLQMLLVHLRTDMVEVRKSLNEIQLQLDQLRSTAVQILRDQHLRSREEDLQRVRHYVESTDATTLKDSSATGPLREALYFFSALPTQQEEAGRSRQWSGLDPDGRLPQDLQADLGSLPEALLELNYGRDGQRLLSQAFQFHGPQGNGSPRLPDVSLMSWLDFSGEQWLRLSESAAMPKLLKQSKRQGVPVYSELLGGVIREYQAQKRWREVIRSPEFNASIDETGRSRMLPLMRAFLFSASGSTSRGTLARPDLGVVNAMDLDLQKTKVASLAMDQSELQVVDSPWMQGLKTAMSASLPKNWDEWARSHEDFQRDSKRRWVDAFGNPMRKFTAAELGKGNDWIYQAFFFNPMEFPARLNLAPWLDAVVPKVKGMRMLSRLSQAGAATPRLEVQYGVGRHSRQVLDRHHVEFGLRFEVSVELPSKGMVPLFGCNVRQKAGAKLVSKPRETAFEKDGSPRASFWDAPECFNFLTEGFRDHVSDSLAVEMKKSAIRTMDGQVRSALDRVLAIFRSGLPLNRADKEFLGPALTAQYGLGFGVARMREYAYPGQTALAPQVVAGKHCSRTLAHPSNHAFLPQVEDFICAYVQSTAAGLPGTIDALAGEAGLGVATDPEAKRGVLAKAPTDDLTLDESISALTRLRERIRMAEVGR